MLRDVEVMIHGETEKAWKVSKDVGMPTVWLPKSQVTITDTYGSFRMMDMPDWLAREKNLA